ncbi:MAG: phosphatase PAP2 family protein [Tabrizicola sp.]
MAAFFLTVVLYTLAALGLTFLVLGEWQQTLSLASRIAFSISRIVFDTQSRVLLLAVPLFWWYWRGKSAPRMRPLVLVAVATILLQIGFFFLKGIIPHLVPFYADPFLADLDRAMLFGHDAWALSHSITPRALIPWFPTVYASVWSFLAFAFPVLLVASDGNAARVHRYLWLFFLSWFVIGNFLTVVGSSVGPVFYDQLLSTSRFDAMRTSFAETGYSSGSMAQLQASLWNTSSGRLSLISAFPSMHVAVATIVAAYIRERFRRLLLLGDAFLGLILLISVYSGYHYLVDGLASVAIVHAINAVLRQFTERANSAASGQTPDAKETV